MGYEGKKAPANKGNKGEAKQEQWLQVGNSWGREIGPGMGYEGKKAPANKGNKGEAKQEQWLQGR